MSRECFEIGTLQAFLDGETAPELSNNISDHVLECDACAMRLAESEEESALVFSALDRELNALVPTQRLWSRINETIETEKSKASWWHRAYAFLSLYLANPSLTAAAGILLFAGIFAFVWMSDTPEPVSGPIASVPATQTQPQTAGTLVATAPSSSSTPDGVDVPLPPPVETRNDRRAVAMTASYRPQAQRATANVQPDVRPATLQYLPGEESYLRTIAELNETVESQKDRVLPVSSRVAFERDLAVVDDAINRTKDTVRKNPNNQAAKQVLYAAYQDKIDLLNSVGQREELMASLR